MKNRDFGTKNIRVLRKNADFPLNFARKHIPHPFGAIWVRLGAAPKLPPRKFENFVIFIEIRHQTPLTGRPRYNCNRAPQNSTVPVLEICTSDFARKGYTDPEFDVEFSNENENFIKNL